MVSPRPPRQDGQGDQRRAHYALAGLLQEWAVDVVSWLPDVDEPPRRRVLWNPLRVLRAMALATTRPLHVAYVQALAPRSLSRRLADYDMVLFVTDRAVPRPITGQYAIDFIDDLGGAASRRADTSNGLLSAFWRWEGRRLRRFDAALAAGAVLSVAVNELDAAAIGPEVQAIPLAIGTRPLPDTGSKVVFAGNLFYWPNVEAAMWICTSLVPRLTALGIEPHHVVIAGRRPPPPLRAQASAAGVDLRADVPDLIDVLMEAAVVIIPVVRGSGVQNKALDAVGAARPCVVTPFTNQVLGLIDGRSALVRERTAEAFAEAIVQLLDDGSLRRRLAEEALAQLVPYQEDNVVNAWRQRFAAVRDRVVVRT